MVIDIDKVVVEDRIRKDFGNIQELAEDIKENGLINPPVVNKEYRLLAGERRLRACKELGLKQIEVRMMDTKDAEHELNIEISENENRKEFSKAERVDYMNRLWRIEAVKAREISDQNLKQNADTEVQNSAPRGKTRKIVASHFGISHDTMKKEMEIVEHQDLLTPEDFADWDEGRLSTNKAYQAIKAALAEKEERIAELEKEKDKPSLRDKFYQDRIKTLGEANDKLKARVVELERIEYEAKSKIPEDYEETKEKLSETEAELKKAQNAINENNAEIAELNKKITKMEASTRKMDNLSVDMFVEQCRGFMKTASSQGKTLLKGKNPADWGDWHECAEVLTELSDWATKFAAEISK